MIDGAVSELLSIAATLARESNTRVVDVETDDGCLDWLAIHAVTIRDICDRIKSHGDAVRIEPNAVYTPHESAPLLQISKTTLYGELSNGRLQGQRVGTRWRILGESLLAYLRGDRANEPKKRKRRTSRGRAGTWAGIND